MYTHLLNQRSIEFSCSTNSANTQLVTANSAVINENNVLTGNEFTTYNLRNAVASLIGEEFVDWVVMHRWEQSKESYGTL